MRRDETERSIFERSQEKVMPNAKVTVGQFAEALRLGCATENIDQDNVFLTQSSINRPAFQLAGYYEYFDRERLQISGMAENEYMSTVCAQERKIRFDRLFNLGFPAMIHTRGIRPYPEEIEAAQKYSIPILISQKETGHVIVDTVTWLHERLSPMETRHGVLVDVFGEGILITGNTGIGKSETAIELIKRGHRMVADDLVEIRKTGDFNLLGSAPEITRHFVEIRGIGVVDIKSLYGVESVKDFQKIDMVINLEQWDGKSSYDRLGLEEYYEEILDVKIVRHRVPVRPGRNLAVVIETAAVNNRQKKMGYNAAQELVNRVKQEVRSKAVDYTE